MELSAREDIEAPIEYVFDRVTDFASFERSIMRRGAEVERLRGGDVPVVGARWRVMFRLRGKERVVDVELIEVDASNGLTLSIKSNNIDGLALVELVALSRARTRLIVKTSVKPKSIAAKLFLQSMRFAKQKTQGRFKMLVARFAEDVDARYRA